MITRKKVTTQEKLNNELEYKSFKNMLSRCYYPTNKDYHYYGGRGILVCNRWLDSFKNFLDDMGKCPHEFTLERKNSNENYSPLNCKWASRKEQQRNRRNTLFIVLEGKKRALTEICEEKKLPWRIIYLRYRRGWNVDRLFDPIREQL